MKIYRLAIGGAASISNCTVDCVHLVGVCIWWRIRYWFRQCAANSGVLSFDLSRGLQTDRVSSDLLIQIKPCIFITLESIQAWQSSPPPLLATVFLLGLPYPHRTPLFPSRSSMMLNMMESRGRKSPDKTRNPFHLSPAVPRGSRSSVADHPPRLWLQS